MTSRDPVATAEQMRRLEDRAASGGEGLWRLMKAAGEGAARHAAIRAAGRGVLVLAGPGNNGGDGYVMASALKRFGVNVAVAALASPGTDLCKRAAELWGGPVQPLDQAKSRPVLVDALFGTGLSRTLGADVLKPLLTHAEAAELVLALDLPSGVGSDDGTLLPDAPRCDETYAFGWLKPGHLLQPGADHVGRITRVDIGLAPPSPELFRNQAPEKAAVAPTAHKYDRGHVVVAAGAMPGAAFLSARAAQRGGAGFVTIGAENGDQGPPTSIVYRALHDLDLDRVDVIIAGPGLGRDDHAAEIAAFVLEQQRAMVIDGDMFSLFAGEPKRFRDLDAILTPHEGEFGRLFGELNGSKIDRVRRAADLCGSVVVLKGRDTVIAAPGGRAIINDHAHPRLAVAGSGDVLAGIVAAEFAMRGDAFVAACAGVWRQGDAGLRATDSLIAEDLLDLL